MPAPNASRNRGPAAAPENRAAIIAAARQLFADQGLQVPLSAIAKAAGVGQAVMYRHFPDRLDLAYAVFADNYTELERLATQNAGPDAFHEVWRRIVTYTCESVGFVEMVIEARRELPESVNESRLVALVAEPLARAQAAGLVEPSWTAHDVLLLQHMVYGVVVAQPDLRQAGAAVDRALALIDPRLVTNLGEPCEE